MRVIAATVLDPTHLELTEPLELRSGAQVAVAVHEDKHTPTVPSTGCGDDPAPLVARAREHGIRSPYVFYVEPPRTPGTAKMGL